MNLFHATRDQINWFISFGRKVRKLTPWEITGGTIGFLFSQLFFFLASFLPLKAILLVASDGVPRYFSGIMTPETKDQFVLGVAVVAIASYGLHLLSDWLMNKALLKGSERIVSKNKKLRMFNSQEQIAFDGYGNLCKVAGSSIAVSLGFALGLYLNTTLFGVLIGLIVGEYIVLHYIFNSSTKLGATLITLFRDKLSIVLNVLAVVNFLIGFVLLFVQFLGSEQREVIVAILSIILIRQLMQRITGAIRALASTAKNRIFLNALFYTALQYVPHRKQDRFIATYSASSRNQWLGPVFAQVLNRTVESVDSAWVDSHTPGVAFFDAEVLLAGVANSNGLKESVNGQCFFVKCYEKKRAMDAENEIRLFAAMPHGIPDAPTYVGDVLVGDMRVVVFEGIEGQPPQGPQWQKLALARLIKLWCVKPDEDLVRAYLRARPTLTARLRSKGFEQLRVAVRDEKDNRDLDRFSESWPAIEEKVECLPLVIRNPDRNQILSRIRKNGDICFLSWNNWKIEPVGCDALIAQTRRDRLQQMLDGLENEGIGIKTSVDAIIMVSRLFELEAALDRGLLDKSLRIVKSIISVAELESPNESFLSSFSRSNRNQWLRPAVAQVLGRQVRSVESRWIDSHMPGVAYFDAEVSFSESGDKDSCIEEDNKRCLIKCYEMRRAMAAENEIQLFTSMPSGLPGAPTYLGDALVDENRMLVFGGVEGERAHPAQWRELGVDALLRLWSVELDGELVRTYLGTHPTITGRLSFEGLERIQAAVENEREERNLQSFIEDWPAIRRKVDCLPLVVSNPDCSAALSRVQTTGCICFLSWSKWKIEPIGCHSLMVQTNRYQLRKTLDRLNTSGVKIKASVEDLRLVSRLFELEAHVDRNRLRKAFDVVENILDRNERDESIQPVDRLTHVE